MFQAIFFPFFSFQVFIVMDPLMNPWLWICNFIIFSHAAILPSFVKFIQCESFIQSFYIHSFIHTVSLFSAHVSFLTPSGNIIEHSIPYGGHFSLTSIPNWWGSFPRVSPERNAWGKTKYSARRKWNERKTDRILQKFPRSKIMQEIVHGFYFAIKYPRQI